MTVEMFRGFIAIDLEASPSLLSLIGSLKDTDADIKLVKSENLHLTLKFLGDTRIDKVEEITSILDDIVKDIHPFDLSIHGCGVFPNEKNVRIIWADIDDEGITGTIAGRIDEEMATLGFKKEKRKFSAHLTLGRMRNSRGKEEALNVLKASSEKEFLRTTIYSIVLMKSTLTPSGPLYEEVQRIPLK